MDAELKEAAWGLLRCMIDHEPEDVAATVEEWINADDLTELWSARRLLDAIQAGLRRTRSEIDAQVASILGKGGAARLDPDTVVLVGGQRTWRVMDSAGLRDWAGEDMVDLVNPQYVRVTSIRELAKRREIDPDLILDTFGEWRSDEAALRVVPMDRAPKWTHRLEVLERTERSERTRS